MVGGWAVGGYSLTMGCRGVALVDLPAVSGIVGGYGFHILVAMGFGEDRGGGDVAESAVAFDEGLPGDIGIGFEAVAVDDNGFRAHGQAVESAVHRKDRCVEDVDSVDFFGFDAGNGPCDGLLFNYGAEELSALFGQLFGVVEQGVGEVGRQNDGGGKNGAGKTSAAGFVAAGFEDFGVEGRWEGISQRSHSRIPGG